MMPPVELESPVEGTEFDEGELVVLEWGPVAYLPNAAYYVMTVAFSHDGVMLVDDTPWVKTDSWELSQHAYLPDLSDDGLFRWSVRVMLQTGVDPRTGKPIGVPLSAPSEVWTFRWYAN